jgi:hypothetical protein
MVKSTTPKAVSLLASETPEAPAAPAQPKMETAQENVAAGVAAARNPDWEEAKHWLAAMIPGAYAGIARLEAWRTSPVVPRPDVDDFPSPHESVDALVAHARVQNAPTYPLWPTFVRARNDVVDEIATIESAHRAIATVATLTPEACVRQQYFSAAHRWPPGHRVEQLANTLGGVAGRQRDTMDARASALASQLHRLLQWSRNQKAAGVRPAAQTVSPRQDDDESRPAVVNFDVFDFNR